MIKLVNVSKIYSNSAGASLGLRKINLTLGDIGLVAITGESGSGKSTLLNIISCLDTYEEGEIFYDGEDSASMDEEALEDFRKKTIGFVYQNYNLLDSFTVLDNVISSMMIKDNSYKESKDKAIELLKKVGLEEYKDHKAANLSSGQKQRLSIARALAKDCPVIACDEPTGNLDSETGKQLIELLSEISKTRLVIVATHNYEDFAPYTDRFIRLYQGELVADETYHEIPKEDKPLKEEGKNEKSYLTFSLLNYKAQPHRTVFNGVLFTICFLVILVMTGYFSANLDSSSTKLLQSDIFDNLNEERIIVRSDDGFTEEEINDIASVKHVVNVDRHDLANEVNYFCEENSDYYYTYDYTYNPDITSGNAHSDGSKTVGFSNYSKFMRSASSIKESDLSAGRLPSSSNEIVLYSTDAGILGSKKLFYFQQNKLLGNNYYEHEMEIVGILKENTSQVYFSDLFMSSFVFNAKNELMVTIKGKKKNYYNRLTETTKITRLRIICNSELESDQIAMTEYVKTNYFDTFDEIYDEKICSCSLFKFGCTMTPVLIENDTSDVYAEVSEELFASFASYMVEDQMSLYIDDFAYVSDTLKTLSSMGYDVISPYMSGSTNYDTDKVVARYVTLAISLAIILVVSFLLIVIAYVFLKLKRKDYSILKSMGLKNRYCYHVALIELMADAFVSFAISIGIFYLLAAFNTPYIVNLLKYLRFYHFAILFVYDMLLAFIISLFFKKFLTNKVSVISLREDD